MLSLAVQVLEIASAAGACCGVIYNLLCIWSARKFIRERKRRSRNTAVPVPLPPVSILKPLRGSDPEMYSSFRSHCLLDYPEYEILFAVHDANDPAVTLVEKLKAEFPERNIQIVVFPKGLGANVKVSNLAQLAPLAKHEYLVVNDSDIRVQGDYLQQILREFEDDTVGLVTCLYRAVANQTIGSKLEALGISTDFFGGVLMAQALEGELRFGLGSTLAFRRTDLQRIGGFEAIVDYLADDYELGARISQSGKRVEIADTVVDTFLPRYSWREFWRHQLRWARGIRDSRPWGYLGLALTHAIPWALLTVAFARGARWAWTFLAAAIAIRLAMAFVVGHSVIRDRQVGHLWWLIPLRDCIALLIWASAFAGRTVYWRGDKFVLKNGRLKRPAGDPSQAVAAEMSTPRS
jgi:ceramide glucosyltransferase